MLLGLLMLVCYNCEVSSDYKETNIETLLGYPAVPLFYRDLASSSLEDWSVYLLQQTNRCWG